MNPNDQDILIDHSGSLCEKTCILENQSAQLQRLAWEGSGSVVECLTQIIWVRDGTAFCP